MVLCNEDEGATSKKTTKTKKQKSTAWPVQALNIFSGSFTLAPHRIFTLKRVSWLGCLRRASARSITLHFRGNLLPLQMYQVAEAQMDSVITKQQLFRKWNTLTWLCVLNIHKRISAIVFSPLWLGLYPTLRDAVPSWTLDAIWLLTPAHFDVALFLHHAAWCGIHSADLVSERSSSLLPSCYGSVTLLCLLKLWSHRLSPTPPVSLFMLLSLSPYSVSVLLSVSLSFLWHLCVMWLLRGVQRQGDVVQCLGRGERENRGDPASCLPDDCQEAHICLWSTGTCSQWKTHSHTFRGMAEIAVLFKTSSFKKKDDGCKWSEEKAWLCFEARQRVVL